MPRANPHPVPGLLQDAHQEDASWSKPQLFSIFQEGLRICNLSFR